MRQRLPIDSLSLEQYTLARCVIQRSQMLQRTRCPVLAHRVILLRLIGRYWRRGGPSASRTQQNAGGLIDVRVYFGRQWNQIPTSALGGLVNQRS